MQRKKRVKGSDVPKLSALVEILLRWFGETARDLPWRRTTNPYGIWVSEIMLQQTQVKTVIPYWERWMRELPSIQSLAEAHSEQIHKLWEGLGYYTRVRNMHKAAKVIGEMHQWKFPTNHEEVLALPGIGRYTAGAICSIAFNQPTPILDGNVIRVLTRVFLITEDPKEKTTNVKLWELARSLVEHSVNKSTCSCSHLNQALMELGALICSPRQPKCLLCPIRKNCGAYKENRTEELPNLGRRTVVTERHFVAFIVGYNRQFLVRQRPPGVVNAHLWEFPNIEVLQGTKDVTPFRIDETAKPLCRIKHSITRYRILLEAFPANLAEEKMTDRNLGSWRTLPELEKLAFTSAHKKILRALK